MKVKTLVRFKDIKEKVTRVKDEEFVVTKERFKEINSTKHGELVEEVKEIKRKK